MSSIEFERNATKLFEQCGFRVIHATKDNIWILHPNDKEEADKYGTAVLSPRAMQAIGELLAKF